MGLIDREKVVKGLKCCCESLCDECDADERSGVPWDCPAQDNMIREAIRLLKEQEPRAPHYTRLKYLVNGRVVEVYHPECPRCFENGMDLWDAEIEKGQAYCKRCGQAVKWDG